MIIRNKDTGQTIQIDDPALAAKYGINLPSEVAPKQSFPQQASDAFRALGLGILPNLAANVTDIGGSLVTGNKIDPNNYQNPFRTQEQLNQQFPQLRNKNVNPLQRVTQGYGQVAKDTAGMASWAVPETKIFGGMRFLPSVAQKVIPKVVQGATALGLQEASQPDATMESIKNSALTGAIANPLFAGAGNVLLDKLPRYFGWRAFGKAGLKYPEVLRAEAKAGTESLKEARDAVLSQFGGTTTKDSLMERIINLAKQPEWVGTSGLQDIAVTRGRAGKRVVESGALKDIENQMNQATDFFDFYNRLKNMAYAKSDSPAANRLAGFMRSAAHDVREQIINLSKNPDLTREAMDMYAAQTAIKVAKTPGGGSRLAKTVNQWLPGGESALGVIGLMMSIPGIHTASIPLIVDAAISNKLVAPQLAKALLKIGDLTGRKIGQSEATIGNALRRLGIGVIPQ